MTVRDVLQSIGRRWYVFLLVLCAAAALFGMLYHEGGSFTTTTSITFTLPARENALVDSGATDSGVIAFASAVATEINQGKPALTYSTAEAPYYGAGVREGVLVSLRNEGNQWTASFPSATIDIQVVGTTYQSVAARQEEIVDDVLATAEAQQQLAVIPASARITATVDPLSLRIDAVSSTRTTQALAAVAIGVAAIIAGGWLSVFVDRWGNWRERSPRPREPERIAVGGSTA